MDNVYRSFGRDIEVSQGSDGPLFNGHSTVHSALLENEIYATFDFADQMAVCAAVMFDVYPLPADEVPPTAMIPRITGRTFVYTYQWYVTNEDYACMVLDVDSGDLVFDEWFKVLHDHGVMKTVKDKQGLLLHLLKHGELVEGDILRIDATKD